MSTCDRKKDISIYNLHIVFKLLMHELMHPNATSRENYVKNILQNIYTDTV